MGRRTNPDEKTAWRRPHETVASAIARGVSIQRLPAAPYDRSRGITVYPRAFFGVATVVEGILGNYRFLPLAGGWERDGHRGWSAIYGKKGRGG